MPENHKIKDWQQLTDEEILQMRIRDLGLQIAVSSLEPLIQKLYEELDARGIPFHPPFYLADEWLCPDKLPIIGIPFCLAHPLLRNIEQKMMFDVEGGTEKSFMKLLRHYRRLIIDNLARWTGHRKYDVHQLVNKFIQRSDVLDLYAGTAEMENIIAVTALLTVIANSTIRIAKDKH